MIRFNEPRVAIIGGGGTGLAILYDLSLQNIPAMLFERGELTSGTTGRHHGQLHSGARYAVNDPNTGAECYRESIILRKIASRSIEYNMGLFAAITDEDFTYLPQFLDGCAKAGIPTEEMSVDRSLRMEPNLSPSIRTAVVVPDGTIDAWRLCLQFAAGAVSNQGQIRTFSRVIGIERKRGAVSGVVIRDLIHNADYLVPADIVINAAGAWSAQVAGLVEAHIDITPSPGTMVAVKGRLVNMVISRLHPSGDGDIIVPQRALSIIGSTQYITDDPDYLKIRPDDVDFLTECGSTLVPDFADAQIHAAWSAPRPLAGSNIGLARDISRGFICMDHGEGGGVKGLISVIGGKATLLRLMAERVVDKICEKVNVARRCQTAAIRLPDYRVYHERRYPA